MTEIKLVVRGETTTLMVDHVPRIGDTVILQNETLHVYSVIHVYDDGGRRGGTRVQEVRVLLSL